MLLGEYVVCLYVGCLPFFILGYATCHDAKSISLLKSNKKMVLFFNLGGNSIRCIKINRLDVWIKGIRCMWIFQQIGSILCEIKKEREMLQ